MKKKAVIILVWIGRFPSYFPLWIRSLEKNSSFDFLLFTDQTVEEKIPENLKVIPLTIRDLAGLISKKLSLRVEILYPYKICDFKPAFGEIFNDYLDGYTFWGCCDLDLLFGDLSKFITDDILDSYKKVLVRGHLTLYRNESIVNAAYRSSKRIDYKKIFESKSCFFFDEWVGIYEIFKELEIDQYQEEIMADIKTGSARYVCTNAEYNFSRQIFVWEDGDVKQYYLNNGKLQYREFAYVHYQKRKIVIGDAAVYTCPVIILNSHSFLSFNGKITPSAVKKYDTPNYGHYLNFQLKRIKRKIAFLRNDTISFDKSLFKKLQ